MSASHDFTYLYNHIACGILTFRSNGKITSANQTLLNWTDLSQDEITQHVFTDLFDKGGKIYYQLFVGPLLRLNGQINEVSINIQGRNGAFPCLFTATVCQMDLEEELTVLVTIFKVLDRKKYEAQLLKAKAESEAQGQIKSQSLEEVALMQAHLVRAPLANILSLANILDDMEVDDEAKDIIAMLVDSAKKLDGVVQGIIKKTEA